MGREGYPSPSPLSYKEGIARTLLHVSNMKEVRNGLLDRSNVTIWKKASQKTKQTFVGAIKGGLEYFEDPQSLATRNQSIASVSSQHDTLSSPRALRALTPIMGALS
jgi:hypothetical protein